MRTLETFIIIEDCIALNLIEKEHIKYYLYVVFSRFELYITI